MRDNVRQHGGWRHQGSEVALKYPPRRNAGEGVHRWAVVIRILMIAVAGCVSTEPRPTAENAPKARDLFPLAVGNRWSYNVAFLGARQQLTVAIVSGEGRTFTDSRNQKFIFASDGLRDEHRYLLKEPLEVGRSWTSIIDVSTSEHYKVAELGVRVDVPAGHFEDCVRIEARNPQGPNMSLVADQVYCPGVGLVRVVTFEERSGSRSAPQFMQELASYKVGGSGVPAGER